MEQRLASLNEGQREAVVHPGGPMLVLAGAGSGKTRVLTLRLAWLIQELGVKPWQLLAVTFTNKAAGEMKERVRSILGPESGQPWVSTFHSACLRILRQEVASLSALESDFVVYDSDESKRLLKLVIKDARLPTEVDVRALSATIDRAKNDALGPEELAAQRRSEIDPRFPELYRSYQERLRRANAVDFGDLLLETIRLFERVPAVRDRYRERFSHVLIDEYQDTNHAQYRFMKLLVDHGDRNVCVVGDEDQSIYSFRGADIRNILDFGRDFPGAHTVRLERNYRSTGTILEAATAIVSANTERLGKNLWTEAGPGHPITVRVAFDDREEARRTQELIRAEIRGGRRPRDIAVFYRTNAQSRLVEEEMIASRLPFVLIGGQRFYERKEVKDALAYLKVLVNPEDDVSLLRIFNEPPRKLGQTTRERMLGRARRDGVPCWTALCALCDEPSEAGRAHKALVRFRDLVLALRKEAETRALDSLVSEVFRRSDLLGRYEREGTFEAQGRVENLEELQNSTLDYAAAAPGEGLAAFLDRVSLVADTDSLEAEEDDSGKVTLMTVHAAKGLEFPVVLVIGLDEDLFPHARANSADSELQEERRLAYVAVTRAQEKLYLLRARRRRIHGTFQDTRESRFLRLIPRQLLDGDVRFSRQARPAPAQQPEVPGDSYVVYDGDPGPAQQADWRSRFDRPTPNRSSAGSSSSSTDDKPPEQLDWQDEEPRVVREFDDESASMIGIGTRVLHPTYGEGEIRDLEGPPSNLRARIQFRRAGNRLVYLRSASLEVLSR